MKTIELVVNNSRTTIFIDRINYIKEKNDKQTNIFFNGGLSVLADVSYKDLLERINKS